jgi:hypothetical protein
MSCAQDTVRALELPSNSLSPWTHLIIVGRCGERDGRPIAAVPRWRWRSADTGIGGSLPFLQHAVLPLLGRSMSDLTMLNDETCPFGR